MTNPHIGLSMLHCLGKPFKKMTEEIPKAHTTFIEIVDDGFHQLNKQRVSSLRQIGQSFDVKYSVHAPFSDINVASPSKPMLDAMLKRMKESMEHASNLNASVWIFHPGVKTGISSFYPGLDWLQNLRTARSLVNMANDYGLKIAIENVPEPFPFLMKSVEDFSRFYAEVEVNVGLTLDVGHSNINGQTERFLTSFGDKIVHVHLSDNDGKNDQHLGIGYGTVNWEKTATLLKRIGYSKVVVVESVEHVEESVKKAKQLFA